LNFWQKKTRRVVPNGRAFERRGGRLSGSAATLERSRRRFERVRTTISLGTRRPWRRFCRRACV
jgi:hypothetical protein